MLPTTPLLTVCAIVLVLVVGACVGSFVNCAALRRETGESVLRGRSHCSACHETLGALELIPVVSWFIQGGACKHCGKKLAVRYPLTEALAALVFGLVAWVTIRNEGGLSLTLVQNLALVGILLYVSLTDIDSRTIPDACIVAAIVLRLLYVVVAGFFLRQFDALAVLRTSLIGGFAVLVPLAVIVVIADRILHKDSMGGGDLKLFFVAGLYFGWRQCLFLVMMACILGIVGALFGRDGTQDGKIAGKTITFGPCIAAACVLTMLVGGPLVGWYEGLF